jgi:hypothetical protein
MHRIKKTILDKMLGFAPYSAISAALRVWKHKIYRFFLRFLRPGGA